MPAGRVRSTRRVLRIARWLAPCATLVAYVVSRVFYARLGLALDDSSIGYFYQYLDPELLRSNLLQSVYYQHTQPPLYNLFLGLALKSEHPCLFLRISGLAFGLGLHLGLYALMRSWRVRAWLAAIVATLFAFNPASILMELWVFYSYPVTAMIVLAAWLLQRGLAREETWRLSGAFGLLAAMVLTRSLFHLAWMAIAVAIAIWCSRRRMRTAAIAILPFALAASVYVKNYVVFGKFASSTWLGFSLSRLTTLGLEPAQRFDLVQSGALSDLAGLLPWLPLRNYPAAHRNLPPGTPQVPALIEPSKSTGHPNLNHAAYIAISDAFWQDARTVLERHPEVWWRNTKYAWLIYFAPVHQFGLLARRNAGPPLRSIERVYEAAFGSRLMSWDWSMPEPPFEKKACWTWAVAMGAALAMALALIVRRGRCAISATLAFAMLTIATVAVIGNSVEVGENNCFRFLTEPLAWALVALLFDRGMAMLTALARKARSLTRNATGRVSGYQGSELTQ